MIVLNNDQMLRFVKARLGISSGIRDEYLSVIIGSVISELTNIQDCTLDPDRYDHIMFVCDLAVWRYQNVTIGDKQPYQVTANPPMPRDLQWRLHNLFLSGDRREV